MANNTLLAVWTLLATTAAMAADGDPLGRYEPPLTAEFRQLLLDADVDAGGRFFDRKCSQCHDAARDGQHAKGPNLWNVMGRKAGSVPGFPFSEAMRKAGHQWTYATLSYYLADTERAVPGREMNFTGIADARMRANVVAYVRTLGDAPPPLP